MSPTRLSVSFVVAVVTLTAGAQTLPLPDRDPKAPSGSEFVRRIESATLEDRDAEIFQAVVSGNVPSFLRHLAPVTVVDVSKGKTNTATFYVAPDYLAVGSDEDYFLTPMTPMTAQRIADRLDCSLPTRKMVDAIYAATGVKLTPAPIAPSTAMTTVPVFATHNETVRTQLQVFSRAYPPGALVAGHQKDVVISAKLADASGKVAIYGWHQTNGIPIQPLYLGHTATWVDYSHGIRLVQQQMTVNGETTTVARVLADANLASLLSDEGVVTNPRYPTNEISPVSKSHSPGLTATLSPSDGERDGVRVEINTIILKQDLPDFTPTGHFGERVAMFTFDPEVKILVNAPDLDPNAPAKPVLLILYALPNGNTTAQTIGHALQPGDDWHFDIQHIGAQTRFLRALLTNQTIVVAYLEAEMKSWPAWRRKHGDTAIPRIVELVKSLFVTSQLQLVLTGHSGGGSFTFGYLNAVKRIPADVVRIAFLDSNYAYETTNHLAKLTDWLEAPSELSKSPLTPSLSPSDGERLAGRPGEGPTHYLCVLAYHDSIALLDGKTFVSERGGTWGRSHAMLADLDAQFPFTSRTNAGLQTHTALDGRIEFLLKENPDRKILHTVQVERNGFIHALLTGTTNENRGYEYLGERAYTNWIQSP